MEAGERIRTRPLVRVPEMGRAVDVVDGRRDVELLRLRVGILIRHAGHPALVNRALLGILAGIGLVIVMRAAE